MSLISKPESLHNKLLFIIFVFLFSSQGTINGQEMVRGIISDQFKMPVSGVTIREKNTELATLSRENGAFRFTVSSTNTILQLKKEGYETLEVNVKSGRLLSIVFLKIVVDSTKLDRSENFGFFNENATNSSGSVFSFQADEFNFTGSTLSDLLDGMAGVEINTQGSPGAGYNTSVRGIESVKNNEPLFIQDGMVLVSGINLVSGMTMLDQLSLINTNDVKSITVLKDAAATAIYGSQGANGVVLIESKTGVNQKRKFSFFNRSGVKLANSNNNLLGAANYISILNQSLFAAGQEMSTLEETQESKNWEREVLRTGFENDFGISLSGGNQKSGYYISGKMDNIIGVLGQSKYNNSGIYFNGKTELGKWLDINLGLNVSGAKQMGVSNIENQFNANPFLYAQQFPPLASQVVFSEPLLSERFNENPSSRFDNEKAEATESRYSANIGFLFKLSKTWTLNTQITSDYSNYESISNVFGNKVDGPFFGTPIQQEKIGILYNWYINNVLKYQKTINNHSMAFLFGTSENYFKGTQKANYYKLLSSFSEESRDLWNLKGKNSRRSGALFVQAHYALNKKWDVTTSLRRENILRRDGTDLFGLFPSFSTGLWLFRKADETLPVFFSGIKARLGWGIVGAETLYSLSFKDNSFNSAEKSSEYNFIPQELVNSNVNPNSRWELTEEWNMGLQANFFNDDLKLHFDYFDRVRNDVAFTDYSLTLNQLEYNWFNSARIHNAGWEFQANYKKTFNDLKLTVNANVLSVKNKLLSLGESSYSVSQKIEGAAFDIPIQTLHAGQELGSFNGYVMEGIFKDNTEIIEVNSLTSDSEIYYQNEFTSPGDIRFKDLDNNGYIDENDVTTIGNSNPDFTYGFTIIAEVKNFDFTLFFDGSIGNQVYNLNNVWSLATGGVGNRSEEINNYWNPLTLSESVSRIHFLDPNVNARPHSGMVEDAGFFRLKKLDFGYTFLRDDSDRKLRAYLSLVNLFTFSSYSGSYPEVGIRNGLFNYTGIDYGWYPKTSTVLIGFQLDL